MVTNDIMLPAVSAYPNPASNTIHIRSKAALRNETFCLKAITGATLRTGVISGNDMEMNVGDLANGIYLLQVGSSNQKITIAH